MTNLPQMNSLFGVRFGGVGLLLQAGDAIEYLPDARIHPLPLAGAAIAGYVQIHARPLLVVMPDVKTQQASRARRQPRILVVREVFDAALCVDEAPVQLAAQSLQQLTGQARPECLFADCLSSPCLQLTPGSEQGGSVWWQVDLGCLLQTLARA